MVSYSIHVIVEYTEYNQAGSEIICRQIGAVLYACLPSDPENHKIEGKPLNHLLLPDAGFPICLPILIYFLAFLPSIRV